MKFDTWEKRPDVIGVAVYDSAQPYDGPGEILTNEKGEKFLFRDDGKRFGPLQDGDYITMRRGKVGYQSKDKLEEWYRPVPKPSIPDPQVT